MSTFFPGVQAGQPHALCLLNKQAKRLLPDFIGVSLGYFLFKWESKNSFRLVEMVWATFYSI